MASKVEDTVSKRSESISESPPRNLHPAAGYQFTFSGGNDKSDIQQLKSLKHVLKGVANRGGKIVISFPDSTYAQVKEFKDCKQTRATKCFSMHHRNGDSDECPEVPIIGVQITNTLQYAKMIKDIFESVGHRYPDISLVSLLRFNSPDEALAVRTDREDPIGQVYFKHFDSDLDLESTFQFFRVGFSLNPQDRRVIIWISLQNRLPIVIKPNNDLYTILPPSPINPPDDPDPPSTCNYFPWLSPMLHNLRNYQSVLFCQKETDSRAVIYPNSATEDKRISIGEGLGLPAIIANSKFEFHVEEFYTYTDHDNQLTRAS